MGDKIPFYPLDLRNISRLVKTKTKTRAQCLMVNTGSLRGQILHILQILTLRVLHSVLVILYLCLEWETRDLTRDFEQEEFVRSQ